MRVKRDKQGNRFRYSYHLGDHTREFPAYEALFQSMSRKMGRRTHLVQKGIHMLKPHFGKARRGHMIRRLKDMGLVIAASMETGYPYLDPFIFRRLRNKSVFNRVFRLTKLHGRFRGRKR